MADKVAVSFSDNGSGIPEEDLKRVFDPFFTTREVGQGTGLGLSVCHGIVTQNYGQIYADNNPDGGAVFTVLLPVASVWNQE
jgi:two-component system NtrC family sensor kinase